MSVQNSIDRIISAVTKAHQAVEDMGGSTTAPYLIENLEEAVKSIPKGEDLSAELVAQDAIISELEAAVASKAGGGTAEPPNIQPLSVTSNGTYTASGDVDGYSPVVVAVPKPEIVLKPLTVTENGTYPVPESVDGYGTVTVNVPSSGDSGGGAIETCELTIRLQYAPNAYINYIWFAKETDGILNTITMSEKINDGFSVFLMVAVGTPVAIRYYNGGGLVRGLSGVNTEILYEDYNNSVIVKCTKSGSASLILEGIDE